jgi:cobalt/nickel transport protein
MLTSFHFGGGSNSWRLVIFLLVLAILSPLGIILPEVFKAGDAWGEWGLETIQEMLGFVPEGLKRLADLWKAPVPDYNLGGEGSPLVVQVLSYILSALIGIGLVGGVIFIVVRLQQLLLAPPKNRRLK